MMELTVVRLVNAPQQRVWDVATDLAGMPTNMSGIVRVKVLTEGAWDVGTRWQETRKMFGKEGTEEMEVAESDPPNSYVVTSDSHGTRYLTTFRFKEVKDDVTEVSMTFGGTPLSTMSKVMSKITGRLAMGSVKGMLEKDLEDLARVAEQG